MMGYSSALPGKHILGSEERPARANPSSLAVLARYFYSKQFQT